MRCFSYLALIIGLLFLTLGCGEEDKIQEPEPEGDFRVVSVFPNGGAIMSNSTITVTLSMRAESVTMTLCGTAIYAYTVNNRVYTFSPPVDGAECELTIEATDEFGRSLEGYTLISFDVMGHHCHGPEIVDEDCIPANGAVDVDPAGVEEIVIVFNETLADVEVVVFAPEDAKIDTELDGDTLTISFLDGYRLDNETEVIVELAGADLAGNELTDTTYSFTTK